MVERQKISQKENSGFYTRHSNNFSGRDFASLPVGLEQDTLLKITCQFKLGDLTNKDTFILAYTRSTIWYALRYAAYSRAITEDIVSVSLVALNDVPGEIKDRLKGFDILKYLKTRIKTKCRIYQRRNRTIINTPYADKRLKNKPVKLTQQFPILENITQPTNKLTEVVEDLQRCAVVEFDKVIIKYKAQGYTDHEIAQLMGCSDTKVTKAKKEIERRYNKLQSEQ